MGKLTTEDLKKIRENAECIEHICDAGIIVTQGMDDREIMEPTDEIRKIVFARRKAEGL